jgi:hypothetical protein
MDRPFSNVVSGGVSGAIHRYLTGPVVMETLLNGGIGPVGISDNDIEVGRHDLIDPILYLLMQAADGYRSGDEYSRHGSFPRYRDGVNAIYFFVCPQCFAHCVHSRSGIKQIIDEKGIPTTLICDAWVNAKPTL